MAKLCREQELEIIKALLERQSNSEIKKTLGYSYDAINRVKTELLTQNKKVNPANALLRSDAISFIHKNKTFTLNQLASTLGISADSAQLVLQQLQQKDCYNIINRGDEWKLEKELPPYNELTLDRCKGKEYKFGVVSDTHLCSKYERLDVLNLAYKEFSNQGVTDVLHCGNMIHGEFPKIMYELNVIGAHNQCMYVANNYPKAKGITTYFITGDCHCGWYQNTGVNIGWYLENTCKDAGRDDIKFIGHIEQDVIIKRPYGDTRIRMMHPGGGSAYALSYPSQKMVESFQGGDKPHILLLGHFHKFDVCYPREVLTVCCGCLQDQTPFMRKLKLAAHVGFLIITLGVRIDGVIGCVDVKWYPFYDNNYHKQLEAYDLKK